MIGTDLFSLATVALTFAGSFGKGDMPADHPERKTAGSSSFLDFDFIKSGAKAYVASKGKKEKPFKSAEFPKTRSVDDLTNPRTITGTPVNRPIGYTNPDVQNAMRALANSSNFGNAFSQGTADAPLGGRFANTGVAGNLLGMPVIASNSVFLDDGAVAADAEKGITKAWTGFDTGSGGGDTDDDDLLRGFAIHESALYWGIQSSNVKQSYQHTYMSDLVSADVLYGAVARCADSAGDRRIIALTDSLD